MSETGLQDDWDRNDCNEFEDETLVIEQTETTLPNFAPPSRSPSHRDIENRYAFDDTGERFHLRIMIRLTHQFIV